jgi:DNA polymerase elongation subunit (family B)
MAGPRLLFIDIETAPIIMAAWTTYEANAVWIEHDTHLLCFAARWYGQKRTKTYALPDYPSYKKNKRCDKALCGDLFKLLDEADVVVAHNGDAFDIKKINSRLIVNGYPPPAPYKTIDTLKIARRHFKFDSNKLDNLGRYLGEGRKIPNTGAALWRGCVNGDPKSWRIMRRYNAQDVDLDVRVYDRVRGWAPNHPDFRMYSNKTGCPTCESGNIQRRGWNVAKTRKSPRFQCMDCRAWFSGKVAAQ